MALKSFGIKKKGRRRSEINNDNNSSIELSDASAREGSDDGKQNNTIMQQINNFSLTPMNDELAEQTIEDHKYLLELVENKCAIAFYAVCNRNQSLYFALTEYYRKQK
jgi:hypothetical protein